MDTIILLTITGVGLGSIYFLVASGLSLIYGLMHVLNFAHGVFLSFGGYIGYEVARIIGIETWTGFVTACIAGALAGGAFALLTELLLIRRLYNRHIEQVLITVGLALAAVALFGGIWGHDSIPLFGPEWLRGTTGMLGVDVPNKNFIMILGAALVLIGLQLFLHKTRYGMIIRAGVENRSMVTALGIDVRKSFALVFTIGGIVAGFGGVMASYYFNYISPSLGQSLLIFAFIVTVIGGLGSIGGAAVASVLVAILQQFANYYVFGTGDVVVVVLLAVVLLVKPTGLLGKKA
ncbi:MAG: branched-chain amino acid ABC transporter permease [Microbacteriaceae bacterium]|nr:branched-chain amino acid ABC transporter permease [Microbacteriaceae bacterium]